VAGHGKVCQGFLFHCRRKTTNLIDNEMYITAGTIFIGLRKHMQDDISRYILQVAGCSLKFNHNWKTAGTKNN